MTVSIGQLAMAGVLLANLFFLLFLLCVERRKPAFALGWILTLIFLPAVGFVLYLFLGTNAAIRRRSVRLAGGGTRFQRVYSTDNQVEVFIAAREKYRRLLDDIAAAKERIYVLYFIIRNDRVGRLVLEALAKKARQGVQVCLLYDHAGCWFTSAQLFRPLAESGAEVRRFFPLWGETFLRFNFRNHRKLVAIDGCIGYLGGMNIGEEYLGEGNARPLWRDTHLRIFGQAVRAMERQFLTDWRMAGGKLYRLKPPPRYDAPLRGGVKIAIVASGPEREEEPVKWGFLQMVYAAKKRIYIQTPYFIPDEPFVEALRIAAFRGVDVVIMTPEKTDNYIAHRVSRSYLGELLSCGVRVYFYQGFLHAKMILADESVVSIGSANLDIRSFALNFELNAFLYGKEITAKCAQIFAQDLNSALPMTAGAYVRRPFAERMEEGVLRLLSPLL